MPAYPDLSAPPAPLSPFVPNVHTFSPPAETFEKQFSVGDSEAMNGKSWKAPGEKGSWFSGFGLSICFILGSVLETVILQGKQFWGAFSSCALLAQSLVVAPFAVLAQCVRCCSRSCSRLKWSTWRPRALTALLCWLRKPVLHVTLLWYCGRDLGCVV